MKNDLVFKFAKLEENRQQNQLNLIASENYPSKNVLKPLSSILVAKYSEGYPDHRYYAGNFFIDKIEKIAQNRSLKIFKLNPEKWSANVQALSGAIANFAVYQALLKPRDRVLSMSLSAGGHLSHGLKVNISGKLYQFSHYNVNENGLLDYSEIEKIAKKIKPKMIICGATAYPGIINFRKFSQIARSVNAILFADISHIAGLVVADLHPSPFPWADIVMTTTHKTLRGPRGTIIISKNKYSELIDKSVFPGIQGGPHDNQTASIALALLEVQNSQFKKYMKNVVINASELAFKLKEKGFQIVTGGTKNHLLLVNLTNLNITGGQAQKLLEKAGIIVNKNMIPNDQNKPYDPSGIRLGTPAITTRGLRKKDMAMVAEWIFEVLQNKNTKTNRRISKEVSYFLKKYPIK
jgi:glycine hydroxymethyltransferase